MPKLESIRTKNILLYFFFHGLISKLNLTCNDVAKWNQNLYLLLTECCKKATRHQSIVLFLNDKSSTRIKIIITEYHVIVHEKKYDHNYCLRLCSKFSIQKLTSKNIGFMDYISYNLKRKLKLFIKKNE